MYIRVNIYFIVFYVVRNLKLRDDVVNDGNCLNDILKNAALVEESYFIAPPGNIPINFNSNEK